MRVLLVVCALLVTLDRNLVTGKQKWPYSSGPADDRDGLFFDFGAEDDSLRAANAAYDHDRLTDEGSGDDDDNDFGSGDDADESSGDVILPSPLPSPCLVVRQRAMNQTQMGPMGGQFIPRCTSTGQFERLQCHFVSGECWCVDPDSGIELSGSRRYVSDRPDCSRFSNVIGRSSSSSTLSSAEQSTTSQSPSSTLSTRLSSSSSSSTSSPGHDDNVIDHFPKEPDIDIGGPPDMDTNVIESTNSFAEPKRRRMSLRASVIGQPGILAGIICGGMVLLLCLVLLVMFCIYRVHRKSHEPEIFYIDKTARMPMSTPYKKVGYTVASMSDHDMYN